MDENCETPSLAAIAQRLSRAEKKLDIGMKVMPAVVGFILGLTVIVMRNQTQLARSQVLLAEGETRLARSQVILAEGENRLAYGLVNIRNKVDDLSRQS